MRPKGIDRLAGAACHPTFSTFLLSTFSTFSQAPLSLCVPARMSFVVVFVFRELLPCLTPVLQLFQPVLVWHDPLAAHEPVVIGTRTGLWHWLLVWFSLLAIGLPYELYTLLSGFSPCWL
jgi:hypothetical protein